jgi:hypothetical protein
MRGSTDLNSPLIQTEYLFSLDHAPSLALADGTTCVFVSRGLGCFCFVYVTTGHVLVLPAEGFDGISDVAVPFEALVSVVLLGGIPGEGALY